MKNYKFRHYLFADKVSWMLLLVTIILLTNHFVMEWDVSAFLAIVILNMLYNIIEKAKYFYNINSKP